MFQPAAGLTSPWLQSASEFRSYGGSDVAVSRTVEEQAFMPAFRSSRKRGFSPGEKYTNPGTALKSVPISGNLWQKRFFPLRSSVFSVVQGFGSHNCNLAGKDAG
jgi:hypothetical protein